MKPGYKIFFGFLVVSLLAFVYLQFPVSVTKTRFKALTSQSKSTETHPILTESLLAGMPGAIQNFYKANGFIGKPIYDSFNVRFEDVAFTMNDALPSMLMTYTQQNKVEPVSRVAYLDSGLYGFPVEGLEVFEEGTASVSGVVGKHVLLFRTTGIEMRQSALSSFLSEILWMPAALMRLPIEWQELDANRVSATLEQSGVKVTGVFTFNEQHELVRFDTEDRYLSLIDGEFVRNPWAIICGEYKVGEDGVRIPGMYQAAWLSSEGDQIYFETRDIAFSFSG